MRLLTLLLPLLPLVVALLAACAVAQPATQPARAYRNPIIDLIGPADPHVIRYQGTYYLYCTYKPGQGYGVFTSTDLVHWQDKGHVFADPRGGIWAPDVFHNTRAPGGDGRIYLYYTTDKPLNAEGKKQGKQVGVAVADGPLGPFVDKGVLAQDAIDAHLFQDDDGSLYLYYVHLAGGFKIMAQPMADLLTKKNVEPVRVIHPTEPWEKAWGQVTEGPFMLKHKGAYYLMYSGSGADGPMYAVGYATADKPTGPFTKHPGNPIAKRGGGVFGPGHHCVTTGPDGKLWMVYHQQSDDQRGWKRFLAIDPLWFDEQGVLHAKVSRGTDQPAP